MLNHPALFQPMSFLGLVSTLLWRWDSWYWGALGRQFSTCSLNHVSNASAANRVLNWWQRVLNHWPLTVCSTLVSSCKLVLGLWVVSLCPTNKLGDRFFREKAWVYPSRNHWYKSAGSSTTASPSNLIKCFLGKVTFWCFGKTTSSCLKGQLLDFGLDVLGLGFSRRFVSSCERCVNLPLKSD